MSLRLKLLLLGLATLVLPWAGCRYAREMESALREGEQNSLLSVAQTIAASLQGRRDLLYREPAPPTDSQDPESAPPPPAADTKPGPYDIRPMLLFAQPFLDGYADEWPQDKAAWQFFARGDHEFGILAGVFERMLYLQLDVRDAHLVYDAPGGGAGLLDPAPFCDRVWLGLEDQDGGQHQFFIAAPGPGPLPAR